MSFDGVGPKVIPDLEQTFLADSGYTSPKVGDPVYVSSNNAVSYAQALTRHSSALSSQCLQ